MSGTGENSSTYQIKYIGTKGVKENQNHAYTHGNFHYEIHDIVHKWNRYSFSTLLEVLPFYFKMVAHTLLFNIYIFLNIVMYFSKK